MKQPDFAGVKARPPHEHVQGSYNGCGVPTPSLRVAAHDHVSRETVGPAIAIQVRHTSDRSDLTASTRLRPTGRSELESNFGDTPYRSTVRYVRETRKTPMELNTRIRPDARSRCDAVLENPHHRRIHLYEVSRETTSPNSAGDWPIVSILGAQTIGSEKEPDQVSRETSCSLRPSQ